MTGKYDVDDFGSGRMDIFIDNRVAHVEDETVMFDRIIEARSARVAWGFWERTLS